MINNITCTVSQVIFNLTFTYLHLGRNAILKIASLVRLWVSLAALHTRRCREAKRHLSNDIWVSPQQHRSLDPAGKEKRHLQSNHTFAASIPYHKLYHEVTNNDGASRVVWIDTESIWHTPTYNHRRYYLILPLFPLLLISLIT